MLISSETDSLNKFGDNKAIVKLMKDSGFEAYDLSMFTDDTKRFLGQPVNSANDIVCKDDYIERAKDLRKYADSIGIYCNQTHAPFPTSINGNDEYNEKVFLHTARAIRISGILGAKCCVVHPHCFCPIEENIEFFTRLKPYAEEAGVKIALENMFTRDPKTYIPIPESCTPHENFKEHLDNLDEKFFGACVDVGHAELKNLQTSAAAMIKSLGKRVIALHVHDNNHMDDSHKLPFTMDMDFNPIIDALAEIGYEGDITLEAVYFPKNFPIALYPPMVKFMAEVASYIRDEVQRRKR